jgi:hypothetical protein
MRAPLLLPLALAACEPAPGKDADTGADSAGESRFEFDPGPPLVPEVDPDGGLEDLRPDLSELRPTPADAEACYLGPDRDDTACLPTVEWSEEWGGAYDYPAPYGGDPLYEAPVRYLDLEELDPAAALAPNFVLSEFASAAKGRFGVVQVHLVDHMQEVRDRIGGPLRVNSGYRNVDYNAGVGGATYSRHQYGDAVDIASDAADLEELADHCASLGAGYVDVYATHVHCDWRSSPLDPAFYPVAEASLASTEDGLFIDVPENGEGAPLPRWALESADGTVLARGLGPAVPETAGAVRLIVRTSPLGPVRIFGLPG